MTQHLQPGAVVRFKAPADTDEASLLFVVVEDRGPRVLVCDVASPMKIKPQSAYAAADMIVAAQATELRQIVALAKAEQDPAALGRLYADVVGYDLHEDDPTMSVDCLRAMLTEFVGEICHAEGIDREVVGLN